jgi:hypothetical protein
MLLQSATSGPRCLRQAGWLRKGVTTRCNSRWMGEVSRQALRVIDPAKTPAGDLGLLPDRGVTADPAALHSALPRLRLVLFFACFGIAETIFVLFRRRRCVPVSMVPLRLSPAHPRPTRRPVRVSRPRKAAGGPEPVAPSVRSESAVASFALLPRQRNQPSDVAAQTFPAPPSLPNPLVTSCETKRSG